ncbi:capsular polysaccharide synthesis protein [Campylobacter coli]|uniref:capsular polysaccharide synthesis protein n=1 Tax=Campylobacter coli TaxID=195 RepID=UPI0011A53305|nr:capsular polysaccharide synthesis protein [Campylobacter coli]
MINDKIIWTFWEPKDKIPGYVKLCIETWKVYFPDYKIVILDYSNLYDFLPKDFYDESLYVNFSLPKQADAIRAAILYLYGGIWLDADTIITSSKIKYFFESPSNFSIFSSHIGVLKAEKGSIVCLNWAQECQKRILNYNKVKNSNGDLKQFEVYYYLGNGPLNPNIEKFKDNKNEVAIFNRIKNKVIMEAFWRIKYENKEENAVVNYQEFYFLNDYSDFVLENEAGLLMLHNSWTPYSYKNLNTEDFLICKNTLSSIFLKILNLDFGKMYMNIRNRLHLRSLQANPLSFQIKYGTAKQRIQNHLSYKLGQAMIINSKSILGYIRMPFVLSYIKDKQKQEQKIYQEKIKKDPSLKLPPLESYPDYKEALKEKECFTYKLGEALIRANKTWYKGGYVKLLFEIGKLKDNK